MYDLNISQRLCARSIKPFRLFRSPSGHGDLHTVFTCIPQSVLSTVSLRTTERMVRTVRRSVLSCPSKDCWENSAWCHGRLTNLVNLQHGYGDSYMMVCSCM
jgi:hypothetical protein